MGKAEMATGPRVLGPAMRVLFALTFAHLAIAMVHPIDIDSLELSSIELEEGANVDGPPQFRMLKTSGTFKLSAGSGLPKPLEEEEDLGESEGENLRGQPSIVEAVHKGTDDGLDLGEAQTDGVFRYTNGEYGGGGGKKKWLKCVSKCKGTGFGGYGFCLTKGEGKPWGGCMAPGADPSILVPPKLYVKNRVSTTELPRAHLFCKKDHDVWMRDGKQLVPACSQCESEEYFLVPNQHIKNMLVGTCFRIDQYPAWIKAAQAAVDGGSASLKCSSFTNNAGMQSKYFGQAKKDAWNSAPKTSAYNPRGFVCTSASPLSDHSVEGLLSKGFREMQLFVTTIARFVMCYTDSEDAASLRCVKKKHIGKCKSFSLRNAAFDQNALHLKSPGINATDVDWKKETKAWDAKALKLGKLKLMDSKAGTIGLQECSEDWAERMLALH